MSHANISHLERRNDAPRQDMLELPADFFGVTAKYFLQDDHMVDWERRKAQIEAWLASLADRSWEGEPLHDHSIPDQILQQIVRWQQRSAMLED